ncbi:hypothetical protein [Myxococcus vastator]|uniref:hypothetical protein n=1 Tax=Myxococcus vastator TaxID=2709664 RepID=UPI0013D3D5D4|nr:hypothetical protein [Myxococcus vastator]
MKIGGRDVERLQLGVPKPVAPLDWLASCLKRSGFGVDVPGLRIPLWVGRSLLHLLCRLEAVSKFGEQLAGSQQT